MTVNQKEGDSLNISIFFVKAGSIYQHELTSFMLLVFSIIRFFIITVTISIVYTWFYHRNVRFLGHLKSSAESVAFLLRSLALIFMTYPSMRLLYERRYLSPDLTVKVVARQWYWSYEIIRITPDPVIMYMLPIEDLSVGDYRFLEVESRLLLPTGLKTQFLVTRRDVIHNFAIPSLGIKVDATAGLLCVVFLETLKVGVHYGQCREICGTNHSFIPFVIEITPPQTYFFNYIV